MAAENGRRGTDAGLVLAGMRLQDDIFRNLVRRLFADYEIEGLRVYVFDALRDAYHHLVPEGPVELVPLARLTGAGHGLLFIIKPDIPTGYGRSLGLGKPELKVPKSTIVLEVDQFGCTRVVHGGDKVGEAVSRDFLFTRHMPDDGRGAGELGHYPYFLLYQNRGEVGSGIPQARFEQDEFGLRHRKGAAGLDRRGDETVIVVHGGSCAYGIFNAAGLSWPFQLEDELNRRAVKVGGDRRRYRVVNMGVPTSALTDCVSRHILLGHRLKPAYVIAHIGWNEARSVGSTDPRSLELGIFLHQHHVTIAQHFWAAQQTWTRGVAPMSFENQLEPDALAGLVEERLQQFGRIVAAESGRLIVGLQPNILSKRRWHLLEKRAYREFLFLGPKSVAGMRYRTAFMHALRDALSASVERVEAIDFDAAISAEDPEGLWFWDYGHTAPDCDKFIAERYADAICAREAGLDGTGRSPDDTKDR